MSTNINEYNNLLNKLDWQQYVDADPDKVYGFNLTAFTPVDLHPWLNDLTIYAKMIAGQWSIPHIKIIRGNITGKLTEVIDCNECRNALKQQERYKQEQSNHEY